MIVTTFSQDIFLSNETNRPRFISMLPHEDSAFTTKQAPEDVCPNSVFIGVEDIDLTILLTALARSYINIYLCKPGEKKVAEKKYCTRSLKYEEIVTNEKFNSYKH